MNDFILPKTGYIVFDSLSFKKFINDKLVQSGVFSDQVYEGSNISTVIDIIAYSYNTLIYYLNRTSTESMFTEAQIYENMNRIVKELDYKPIGNQTSTLTFVASAQSLTKTLYTIPKYSYITIGSTKYSFNEDATFSVGGSALQEIPTLYDQKLLYQGEYKEYPVYIATGQDNEIIFVTPGAGVIIDHFNIDVYVLGSDGIWEQWEKTNSLYLEDAAAKKYEVRFNENQNYEIKFGNNINGKALNKDDQVAIYYLQSIGADGEIGVGELFGKKVARYSTIQFDGILQDTNVDKKDYMTTEEMQNILFDNTFISSYYQVAETVDSIRQNAPGVFRSQYRLVTEADFENYIKTNFAYLIHDAKAVNNWEYLSQQMKYYYDLGISNPNNTSNILYNQVNFADACNFNNVYITIVPKTISDTQNPNTNLSPAQKELIISSMRDVKLLTSEIVILDPVYIAVDICMSATSEVGTIEDIDNSELYIVKDANSRRDNTSIQSDVNNIFVNYFSRGNLKLGDTIDLNALTAGILGVTGVKTFYVRRKDDHNIKYNGLTLLTWNPIYPTDAVLIARNRTLEYFKQAYLNNLSSFINKIVVEAETKIYENIEY